MMTDEELFLRRCADMVEAEEKDRREAPGMVELRKWAIEQVLKMPVGEHLTRVGPPLFGAADDLVRYAETGKHSRDGGAGQ